MNDRGESAATSNGVLNENTGIDVLGLSGRTHNCLRRAGIHTVLQLAPLTDKEISDVRNLGPRMLAEIRQKLDEYLAFCPNSRALVEEAKRLHLLHLPTTPSVRLDENTPIEVLQLSTATHNRLRDAGIKTVLDLASYSGNGFKHIDAVSAQHLVELRKKLLAYLDACPERRALWEQTKIDLSTGPLLRELHPELMDRAKVIPLEDISVVRLALPEDESDYLSHRNIKSIGELVQRPSGTTPRDSLVRTHLGRYLTWIVEQDADTWQDEVAGRGISPLHRLTLTETTLDELVECWLGSLNKRQRKVLSQRFGRDGPNQTLADIGHGMGVTRERVRQIERSALDKLSKAVRQSPVIDLVVVLAQGFVDVGGLMTVDEVDELVGDLLSVEDIDSVWITKLLLNTCDRFEEAVSDQVWGLSDRPLTLVPLVNSKLVELLEVADAPISFDQLVSDCVATSVLCMLSPGMDEAFIAACLRTNCDVDIADGGCFLRERAVLQKDPELSPKPEPQVAVAPKKRQRQPLRIDTDGDYSSDEPPTTLEDWELFLRAQVGQVELLGEIPISDEERARLGKVIGLRIRTLRPKTALDTLRTRYPVSLAVFLVAQGVYGYQGLGGYWPGVSEAVEKDLGPNWSRELGLIFEDVLEGLGLPQFPDLGGRRYVDLILMHGGIPDFSLDDFFKNMLQPSIVRDQYADMSAAELIEEWGWRSTVQQFTDKPVLRFVAYGGQVAIDSVERCREMAWETRDTGIVPDPKALGLPARVVDAYREWIAKQDVDAPGRRTDQWRLRKPEILVDPWGEGVILDLPPQQVPATDVRADVLWQVSAGEEAYPPIPVRVRRAGYDLKTEAELFALRSPAEEYQISLLADGQVKRSWRFRGVDAERPILVFDPERGTALSWQHSLPARPLSLLYPTDATVQIDGQARLLEALPQLPWGWADLRGGTWDLSGASCLNVIGDGESILAVPLRQDESAQRPSLVGGQLLDEHAHNGQVPVYVGSPPRVRVPLTGRVARQEELNRWRVTVRNKWSATPEIQIAETLADFVSELIPADEYVDLPLGAPTLLGSSPCGNFVVRLRGPLGRDAEFTLRTIPHLRVSGQEELYIPDAKNGPPLVKLRVETVPAYELDCQGSAGECHVQLLDGGKDAWSYEVEVPPEETSVDMTVVRPSSDGDPVRVPVAVPIRRLRWALMDDQSGTSRRAWTGRIVTRPFDALLQGQSPCILIALPISTDSVHRLLATGDDGARVEPPYLELRLLDVDGAELQVADTITPPRSQRLWRFELAAFFDTLRASRSPVLTFELVLRNLPENKEPVRLPVVSLTRTLIVKDVELVTRRAGNRAVFDLNWRESERLSNRSVRFWPLWRPWDPFFEHPIPDEAKESLTIEAPPDKLRSGKYRVEFVVIDPWVSAVIQERPMSGTPSTADVELISPEKQLQYLEAQLGEKGYAFDLFLERAVIYQELTDPDRAQVDRQWCYEHLDDGTIPQILTLVALVDAAEDRSMLRALQLKMFAAFRVERLLVARSRHEVSSEHFQAYLANLPRSGMLPETTCKHLLQVDDERVRLHALQQLIRRNVEAAVDTVLEWVESARLSDSDAITLLSLDAQSAVACLRLHTDRSTARRLLDALSLTVEDVIRVGEWVHSDLGWGRIERIENIDSQANVRWCVGRKSRHELTVVLHPDVAPEEITIDLSTTSARFPKDDLMVMICSECDAFSTQRYPLMERHFDLIHPVKTKKDKKKKGEKYIRFHYVETMPIPLSFIEFAPEKPDVQWL